MTDNEDKDQTGYVTFVQALRTLFATDKTKQYYISAAPQCPLPDASIPVGAMTLMDFVVSIFPIPLSPSLSSSLIAPTPFSPTHPIELEQITDSGSYTVGPILQQRNLQHRRVRLRRQLHGLEQEHCRGPPIVHWRSGLPSLCGSRLPGSRRGNFGHQERHGGECG